GLMRSVVRFNNSVTNAGLGGRLGLTGGYFFDLNLAGGFVGVFDVATAAPIQTAPLALLPDTDYNVEVVMLDAFLSLKVWPASDPDPGPPQVILADFTYASGALGPIIGTVPGADGVISATFDDITFFNVPAPGTIALLGLGGLVAARRRR